MLQSSMLATTPQVLPHEYSEHAYIKYKYGGARGVMVIVVGNGHGDTSSNPERDR